MFEYIKNKLGMSIFKLWPCNRNEEPALHLHRHLVSCFLSSLVFSLLQVASQGVEPVRKAEKIVSEAELHQNARPQLEALDQSGLTREGTAGIVSEAAARLSAPALEVYAPKYAVRLRRLGYTSSGLAQGEDLDNLCFILSFSGLSKSEKELLRSLPLSDWLRARMGDKEALERYVSHLKKASAQELGGEVRHILSIGLDDTRIKSIFLAMLESDQVYRIEGSWDRVSLAYDALLGYVCWNGWYHGVLASLDPRREVLSVVKPSDFNTPEAREIIGQIEAWLKSEFGRTITINAPYFYLPDDEL